MGEEIPQEMGERVRIGYRRGRESWQGISQGASGYFSSLEFEDPLAGRLEEVAVVRDRHDGAL